MEKNIWSTYNFDNEKELRKQLNKDFPNLSIHDNESMNKIHQAKLNFYKNKYIKYFDIVNGELSTMVGDVKELSIECGDLGLEILINRSCIYRINIIEDNYIINMLHEEDIKISLNNLDIFKEIIKQVIEKSIIPELKDSYKRGYIKNLPTKLNPKEKINFDEITKEWLTENFYKISEYDGNGEIIENVKIKLIKKECIITFDADCGRAGVHRNNEIKINDKGFVKMNFCEIIEGGDIESQLKRKIEEYIKS